MGKSRTRIKISSSYYTYESFIGRNCLYATVLNWLGLLNLAGGVGSFKIGDEHTVSIPAFGSEGRPVVALPLVCVEHFAHYLKLLTSELIRPLTEMPERLYVNCLSPFRDKF